MTDRLAKKLKIERCKSEIQITGIGETPAGSSQGHAEIQLRSTHSEQLIKVTAHIVKSLTSSLPSFSSPTLSWAHLQGLQLADPEFLISRPVDILIGADAYGLLMEDGLIKGLEQDPIAQRTKFGWIVLGPTSSSSQQGLSHHGTISNQQLEELLTKFWVQEEVPKIDGSDLTPEEADCEDHFKRTHTRDSSGRYIVRLPLCASPTDLGESRSRAQGCLTSLLRRITKDPVYAQLYVEFLQEYEALGHMMRIYDTKTNEAQRGVPVFAERRSPTTLAHDPSGSGGLRVGVKSPVGQAPSHQEYFFPHHGVLRESSETTKLRVVFNGSSKTSTGKSLNDIMHTGAKLQRNIQDVLLWSRQHRYIFMTDITKMFRQIQVHQDDWPLQQILWTGSTGEVVTYQLTTVTYGTRAAPFLAVRVLDQLVQDEGHRHPLAIGPLQQGRYVDDICGGADTPGGLEEVAHQVTELCKAGGFPLAKWHSNSASLQGSIAPRIITEEQHNDEETITKILGLSWLPSTDDFKFTSKLPETSTTITKRIILSEVAQLFDPLGFLAPVLIKAKILLQSLWLEKLGWDDKLSPQTTHRWIQFREELEQLKDLSIPRWLGLEEGASVEIHGFSDASQLAMAAVVYLKVTSRNGVRITLVSAKTKVAPLKRLVIPRLELSAAVLLAKLTKYIKEQLNIGNAPVFLWTDSSVAHAWIRSHPSRWKEYVHNRVAAIQDAVPEAEWRYISGKENPADCASRGLTVKQLASHKLWWTGPPWLKSSVSDWPSFNGNLDSSAMHLEEKPGVLLTALAQPPALWDLVDRYSSLERLFRVTAICQRFIARLRKIPNTSLKNPLNPGDIESARNFWVKATQLAHLKSELKVIAAGMQLGKSHTLTRLTAFLDHQGILRVGGRLNFAQIHPESKHQAIIPKESQLAQLIIREAHLRTFHGGTQLTLAYLRRSYWILGGRAPVRSFILKCVPCARQRGVRAQQLMGQLPASRLTPSRAFLHTGVDYAGPVSLRSWKGRGHKSYKGWLCIFVCMATSAVHLEVVSDYTAEGFLAAYRRFTSRRGICRNLYSDCGTTFLGAHKELTKLFASSTKEARDLAQLLLNDGTQWSFNPPSAPHFGGKWEAAVKSVKHHLTRTIGDSLLTFEELSTLLSQIEAVLNSRPLEPLTDDPDDLGALTPGHFLIGEAPTTVPEPSLELINEGRLNRWQLIQQKLQHFWKQWSGGYLQRQQAINKWHHPSHIIKIGSLVLLTDERFPPSKWPLARVIALHPGKDGLTRVVTIRTAATTLERPIAKLVLLPVHIKDE